MAEGRAFWLGVGAGVAAALSLTCAARYAYVRRSTAGMSAWLLYKTCSAASICMYKFIH